jgi:hypothetical protein
MVIKRIEKCYRRLPPEESRALGAVIKQYESLRAAAAIGINRCSLFRRARHQRWVTHLTISSALRFYSVIAVPVDEFAHDFAVQTLRVEIVN